MASGAKAPGYDAAVAVEHLRASDAVLKKAIDRISPFGLQLQKTPSTFGALAEAIVFQQLSPRAAGTIFGRPVAVRGIGRWTAQMFLIFRLGRPDVLPVDDYGLRRGFATAFRLRELPEKQEVASRGARWGPYRSAASWYLWRVAEEAPPGQGDKG